MAEGHDQGQADRGRCNTDFNNQLPGVNFNFSQYIQDNIEEAMSGVKGSNSVKIDGPSLETLTELAAQVRDQMGSVRGVTDLGIFPVLGQPDLGHRRRPREGRALRTQHRRCQHRRPGGTGRNGCGEIFEGDRQFDLVVRYAGRLSRQHRQDPQS